MSLMVNPVVAGYVNSLEHHLRIKRCERRCRALDALVTPTVDASPRSRFQGWVGDLLIAAGNRLRSELPLEPNAA
jgi:hypothetical protein